MLVASGTRVSVTVQRSMGWLQSQTSPGKFWLYQMLCDQEKAISSLSAKYLHLKKNSIMSLGYYEDYVNRSKCLEKCLTQTSNEEMLDIIVSRAQAANSIVSSQSSWRVTAEMSPSGNTWRWWSHKEESPGLHTGGTSDPLTLLSLAVKWGSGHVVLTRIPDHTIPNSGVNLI